MHVTIHSRNVNLCCFIFFPANCLKEYIGECAEITETSDVVYIGSDFPDEFAHSKDTKGLRGANMYAKDGKLYLYDILRTKKETSKPLEQ